MNKAAAWSIKGVDFDAREAAREAAELEGMSLGEWLNDVIAERAADVGVDGDDFSDDERLNAVSTRLARMRDGQAPAKRRSDRRRAPALVEEDDRIERPRRASRNMSRDAREREVSWRDSRDAESMLEDAIEAFEARISRGQAKTARTLAEVADLVQNASTRGTRETQLLKSISRQLADIEQRVTRGGDEEDSRPVRSAIARLESRIEELARPASADGGKSGLRDLDTKLSEIADQLDRDAPTRQTPGDERLARIERTLSALSAQMEKSATSGEPRPSPVLSVVPATAPGTARRPLVDAVSQIAQRQRELDGEGFFPPRRAETRPPFDMRRPSNEIESRLTSIIDRLERRLPPEGAPEASGSLTGLQGDIARMSAHIEKMREDAGSRPSGATSDASLDKLRNEIAAVTRGLGDLAPRASVSAIERMVRDMADRLEAMRLDPARGVSSAPVEQIARELRAGMRELDPRPAINALEHEMRAITEKIENLDMRRGVDPQAIRAIYDQTREVRDLLSRAATASLPGERAQRDLADIAQRLEQNAGSGIAAADVAHIVGDIRAVVAEGLGSAGLKALEDRVERLSERIDAALTSSSGGEQIAAFGDRLDKLHRAVAQSLAAPRPQAGVETQHLEDLVRDLANKVDRAADPHAGRDDLLALQHQIENLSVKIERSNGRDETVASLERMMGDLFAQLNDTRAAAFEAAESAARSAVRDALANAPATAGGQNGVSREIADLRQLQDASDQRTHATLKAVHETLERVVDRLTTLEDDLVENRSGVRDRRAGAADLVPQLAGTAPQTGSSMSVAAALARKKGPPPVEGPVQRGRPEPLAATGEDVLIEPGAGRGRRPQAASSSAPDSGDRSAQAGFIAAARRAALAAQAASAASEEDTGQDEETSAQSRAGGAVAQAKAVFEKRRKPILLTAAAAAVVLGAWQIARVYTDAGQPPEAPIVRPATSAPAADAAKKQTQAPDAGKKAPVADIAQPPADGGPTTAPPAAGEPAPLKSPSAAIEQPTAQQPAQRRSEIQGAPASSPDAVVEAKKVDPTPVGAIARKSDEPAAVMASIETAASRGDPVAQYELGARRAEGNQVARDLKGSAEMFEKSATKGFAPAQYRLGVVYERGLGLPRDTALAKLWYQRAADRGNVRAMHNLAVLLADGEGKPDYPAAAKWFRRAAEYGVRDSQYNLAILYARGMGGPQDLAQSYAWFAAAAVQGDEDAGKKRDDIAGRMDSATLARAKAMSAAFRPRAIDPSVNEVAPPPGGWQALQPPAKPDEKTPARPKVSRL